MSYTELKKQVWQANLDLVSEGLVKLTWGNASGADVERGVMIIKPSGVAYDVMQSDDMAVVEIAGGKQIEGDLKPSSDSMTHLEIYRAFSGIGAIVHTHSNYATAWAQACRAIPNLGTTHSDHFPGPVPIARKLSDDEISTDYEKNTGRIIVECLKDLKAQPAEVPAVLAPHHGPFVWGKNCGEAVANSVALEAIAKLAAQTFIINPNATMPQSLQQKHFSRKHGAKAYYGQD